MPRPFVAYLRVYEPLSAFDEALVARLRPVVDAGGLDRSDVGRREREVWLKSQLHAPPSTLPGELADGRQSTSAVRDLLVIDPADVPAADDGAVIGPGPLICPLDLRARSAAAMVGFVTTATPVLRDSALAGTAEAAKAKAATVLGELPRGAVHVVSTTWTVPLPWFSLVDPAAKRVVSAPTADPRRQVFWRAAIGDARRRAERARDLAAAAFGETGPTRVLADTVRWLENFHDASAVELDYGGLVQLIDDDQLAADTSAEDVHAIIEAIESSDGAAVGERFDRLREFWGGLAAREQQN
ncbi:hypothetical protein ACOBQX_15565 [Actinokineospora sp. G85]|uniref:hypothetical protein n=1 Tax=Actinokineospora sp. G85 TaxID=3406626 RepID=UPI003C758B22